RCLRPRRSVRSIMTLSSIMGVTLGVTVLILVISVMTGFDRELRQKIIDFDAHILVKSEDVVREWRTRQKKIDSTPHVVATAPFVQGPVIVEFQNQRLAPIIRGIDPAQEEKVIPIRKFIKEGQLDLDGESAVLGSDLARILRINVGDKLTIYSPGNLGQILDEIKNLENAKGADEKKALDKLREVVLPKDLTVTGIFETGRYQYDSEIIWVFLGQGTVVGLFGTLTGLGLGMTLIRYRNEFSHWLASTLHIEIFPREVYQFSEIPAQVIPQDVTIICISAFLICSLAAL